MIRILVIDDDRMNCDLLQAVLTRQGYQVLSSTSGVEGLTLFRKHRPRITILDLRMPEMDGLEATSAIRAKEKITGTHQQVVALTAHAMKGDREK